MKLILLFLLGLVLGILLQPEPKTKFITKVETQVITKEVIKKTKCHKTTQPPISPSLVLGIIRECRAGKLQFEDPSITIRP